MLCACVVEGCGNKPKTWSNLKFHMLATKNPDQLKQWVLALNTDTTTLFHSVVNVAVTTWSEHVYGAISRCVLGPLEGSNHVFPLLPLNVQNCQCEAAIW